MFTGLVEEIGIIEEIVDRIKENSAYRKIRIKAIKIMQGMSIGESINVNGVCQTVVKKNGILSSIRIHRWFEIESLGMTLKKTNFSDLSVGSHVNLERALRFSDRLGGHLISGHVEQTAEISRIEQLKDNTILFLLMPSSIMKYIIEEGSISINGISLTVARIKGTEIMVSIIPHTFIHTTIQYLKVGDRVNIETDMILKYVSKLSNSMII